MFEQRLDSERRFDHDATMHRTYVRRRRAFVLMAVLLIGALSGPVAAAVSAGGPQLVRSTSETPTTYVVREGDTLWAIAASAAPQRDPRETLAAIRVSNPAVATSLEPGQVLTIPGQL
jgi:LysM domain